MGLSRLENGFLDQNELKNLYPKLVADPAPYLLEYFDKSEDGKISREELRQLFDIHHTGKLDVELVKERINEITENSVHCNLYSCKKMTSCVYAMQFLYQLT